MATDEWITALDEYITQNPNDWIAKWLQEKISPPRRPRRTIGDFLGGPGSNALSLPDWMGSLVSRATPTQKTTMTWEHWEPGQLPWIRYPVTKTETVPGAVTGLRPLGAQENLTADQLEQLMYYYGYLKGGGYVPERTYKGGMTPEFMRAIGKSNVNKYALPLNWAGQAEPYLEMVAYQLPNWWNDYIGLSKSLMPTKSAPRARISARWQR